MYGRVERAAAELAAAVAELAPDAIPAQSVVPLFDLFDRAERHAATGKTLLARRVEDRGGHS